jgi:actin-related protein
MAEINVLVLDNGSDTIKAGYCIPERDPLLVRSRAAREKAPGRALSPRCHSMHR